MVFNSLVDLRQRVRQAWSLVDVQLQRRHDLIPNLVEAVKGYRDYEQQLQTELAALRGQLLATPPGVTGPDYQRGRQDRPSPSPSATRNSRPTRRSPRCRRT